MVTKSDLDEIIPRITGELKAMLESELSLGNEIVEVAGGWPFPNANVWLKDKFKAKYDSHNTLEYHYLGDPKNWLEHYANREIGAMVAVRAAAKT
jgi:hypothetical protein